MGRVAWLAAIRPVPLGLNGLSGVQICTCFLYAVSLKLRPQMPETWQLQPPGLCTSAGVKPGRSLTAVLEAHALELLIHRLHPRNQR